MSEKIADNKQIIFVVNGYLILANRKFAKVNMLTSNLNLSQDLSCKEKMQVHLHKSSN